MAWHVNDDGHDSCVGNEELEISTALKRRTVQRAREWLTEVGAIVEDLATPRFWHGPANKQPRNFAVAMGPGFSHAGDWEVEWNAWRPLGRKGAELHGERLDKLLAEVGMQDQLDRFDDLFRDTFGPKHTTPDGIKRAGWGVDQLWLISESAFLRALKRWEARPEAFAAKATEPMAQPLAADPGATRTVVVTKGARADTPGLIERWQSLLHGVQQAGHPERFHPLLEQEFGTWQMREIQHDAFDKALSAWERKPQAFIDAAHSAWETRAKVRGDKQG